MVAEQLRQNVKLTWLKMMDSFDILGGDCDHSVHHLIRFGTLRGLEVLCSRGDCPPPALPPLCSAIQMSSSFHTLAITDRALGVHGPAAIASLLRTETALTSLDLRGAKAMTDEQALDLASAVIGSTLHTFSDASRIRSSFVNRASGRRAALLPQVLLTSPRCEPMLPTRSRTRRMRTRQRRRSALWRLESSHISCRQQQPSLHSP